MEMTGEGQHKTGTALTYHCDLDIVARLHAKAREVVGVVGIPLVPSVVGYGAGGGDGEVQSRLQNGGAAGTIQILVLASTAHGKSLGFRGIGEVRSKVYAKTRMRDQGGRARGNPYSPSIPTQAEAEADLPLLMGLGTTIVPTTEV